MCDLVDIHSIRPGAGLSREQRTQAVQLLGRRCSSSDRYSSRGRVLAVAAADTMIPLAHMLLTGDDWDKLSPVSITLGVGGKRRVLDAPMVRALGVELLMAQRDGRVVGAALLTKAAPQLGRAGFVVPQLVAVDETVENSGVGSALLEAACAVAVAHDPAGSLIVPAYAPHAHHALPRTCPRFTRVVCV